MVPTRLDLQQRSQAESRLTTHSSLTRQDATTANLLTIVGRPRDAQYATFSFLTADDAVADDDDDDDDDDGDGAQLMYTRCSLIVILNCCIAAPTLDVHVRLLTELYGCSVMLKKRV